MKSSQRFVALVSLVGLASLLVFGGCAGSKADDPAPTPEETTLTQVGQLAPDFTLQGLDGQTFTLSAQKGRIVLINWFATWCPPCQQEMPHLQSEVWERFAGDDLVMVSIAREEKPDVVAPFVEKYGVTWPFLVDPERTAYAKYAEAFIPRNCVIDRDGKILFQSQGFEAEEFQEMIGVIATALKSP